MLPPPAIGPAGLGHYDHRARPHGGGAYGLLAGAVPLWSAALLAIGTAFAAVVRSYGELGARASRVVFEAHRNQKGWSLM